MSDVVSLAGDPLWEVERGWWNALPQRRTGHVEEDFADGGVTGAVDVVVLVMTGHPIRFNRSAVGGTVPGTVGSGSTFNPDSERIFGTVVISDPHEGGKRPAGLGSNFNLLGRVSVVLSVSHRSHWASSKLVGDPVSVVEHIVTAVADVVPQGAAEVVIVAEEIGDDRPKLGRRSSVQRREHRRQSVQAGSVR